jgi:hypothetical protein
MRRMYVHAAAAAAALLLVAASAASAAPAPVQLLRAGAAGGQGEQGGVWSFSSRPLERQLVSEDEDEGGSVGLRSAFGMNNGTRGALRTVTEAAAAAAVATPAGRLAAAGRESVQRAFYERAKTAPAAAGPRDSVLPTPQ